MTIPGEHSEGGPESETSMDPSAAQEEIQESTLKWESLRAICSGFSGSALRGLALLVAVQHFKAGDQDKAWLAAAWAIGLLLTPLSSWAVAHLKLTVTWANTLFFFGAAVGVLFAGLFSGFEAYFWGLMLGLPLISLTLPMITTLWRQNIRDEIRGRLFSTVGQWGMAGGLGGTLLIALWLRDDASRYVHVLIVMSLALLGASFFSMRTHSRSPLPSSNYPLASLLLLKRDPLFGYVSLAWMVMGFGNLATMPLRIEFVSNETYGLSYPPWLVLCLFTAVPEIFRIMSVRFWGRIFDRANFIVMRIILNLFFALSIGLFFIPHLSFQILSAIFLGLGFGGGEIAWSLWVTKFAPPERTADYMSVHTFLTGTRGLVAPILAYHFLSDLGIQEISWIGSGMVCLASLLLAVVIPLGRKGGRLDS